MNQMPKMQEYNDYKHYLEILKQDLDAWKDPQEGERRIKELLEVHEKDPNYLRAWERLGEEDAYPSQGLISTPYDDLGNFNSIIDLRGMRSPDGNLDLVTQTLRVRRYFLELVNHPRRIEALKVVNTKEFVAPKKVDSKSIDSLMREGVAISIGDLGASVVGSENSRISRGDRYADGPFVKLGKQARMIFVGAEQPDTFGSSAAISTMAALQCLATIPRNGPLNNIQRQADLARESLEWLECLAEDMLSGREDKEALLNYWKHNISGALEASPKSLKRAEALYKAGVRTFRVYSPEPGTGPVETVSLLRSTFGNEIEIFTGQIVEVKQAIQAQIAGADGIYLGIGGGGRCTTGVRSGSAIDWPELLWNLRGEIQIPVIIQGGASDHIAVSLLLGASGIGVSRAVSGGTIESPGGLKYYKDENNNIYKPYGGEASARTKYLDGKLLPFGIPSMVEGETRRAELNYNERSIYPTMAFNLHRLNEEAILSMVFRGAETIEDLHSINPSPLKVISSSGEFQRNTH